VERVELPRSPVEEFTLPVVGGRFVVMEVLLAPGQNARQAVDSIRSQPAERWLVMTAAGYETQGDALALINDAYECQVVALGNLHVDNA
jgi:hypothetical protein